MNNPNQSSESNIPNLSSPKPSDFNVVISSAKIATRRSILNMYLNQKNVNQSKSGILPISGGEEEEEDKNNGEGGEYQADIRNGHL